MFLYSMALMQIYFVRMLYCSYDNDDELNDDNFFKFYLHRNTV